MHSKRHFYLLLAVTVVVVAAAVWSQRSSDHPPANGLHLPDLEPRIDEVRTVVLDTADASLRLERTEKGWVAASETGYPADAARVRQLVLGLSRLQRLEKKTSDPDRLATLELADVDQPGSKAVRVTLLSGEGEELAGVLVGKTQEFQASGRSRYFVRDAGDPQSWLVDGSLPPVLEDLSNWLQQALLAGIEEGDLRSLSVTHADGETVSIQRRAEDGEFQLSGDIEADQIDSQYSVSAIAQTFRRMSLKDLRAMQAAPQGEAVATVEALTFSGVRITAEISKLDPDYGVRLSAEYRPGQGGSGEEGEGSDGSQLARDLNGRWEDRLFIVSQYALDALLVRRADLVKPPESSEAE